MDDTTAEGLEARIAVRDQLLDGIVKHLRARDERLAGLVGRIIGVIRANDDRVADAGVSADVQAFAEMDLSRGKSPRASGSLREARLSWYTMTLCLRDVAPVGSPKRFKPEWEAAVQAVWRECFPGSEPLDPKDPKALPWVLRAGDLESKALRLVFLATRSRRRRQEQFEDFRKQVLRQTIKPHPWLVRDTQS